MNSRFLITLTFAVFSMLLVITGVIAVITFLGHGHTLSQYHLHIMIFSMIFSVGYGFFWSQFLLGKVKSAQTSSQHMWQIIQDFLSKEEKLVLQHLLENNGKSTQSKISHLHDMGGVKALRTVQKMQEKNLVIVEKEGKIRNIRIHNKIRQLLI